MAELSQRATLRRAATTETALTALAARSLTSVLVADSAVTSPRFKNVSAALVKFARDGGRVIFASEFVSLTTPPNFKKYFRSEWGLNWEMEGYERNVHSLQDTRSERLKALNSLPPEYSMKAVTIKGHKTGDAVYASRNTGAAVVFAKLGQGGEFQSNPSPPPNLLISYPIDIKTGFNMNINDLPNEILCKIFECGTDAARDWDSTGGIYEAYVDQQEARIQQIELENSEDDDSSSRPSLGDQPSNGAPGGSPNHPTDFQVLCSHVCTQWRAICLGNPLLWNKIYIRYAEDPSIIKHNKSLRYQKTRAWLARSGDTAPLDIKVNFKHERPVPPGDSVRWLTPFDVNDIVPVIVPHINRWRSFNMTTKTLKMMRVLLKAIQLESAPQLKHLLLQAPTLGKNTPFDPYRLLKGGAPNLRHLALAGLSIDWDSLDFPRLQELGIFRTVSTEDRRLTRDDVVGVHNRSPKLESLVIEGAFISQITTPPVPPATIPSLRHLVLETGIPEGPPVDASVLSWIYAPNLLSLHALGWERSPISWNFILRTLSEGYSGLTCLSLLIEHRPSPNDVPYSDVFRNLQALEDLTLHCAYDMPRAEEDDAREVYCVAPLMDAEVCPRLVRLVAMNTGTSIGDWIDLAARRDGARRRLQRLVTNARAHAWMSEDGLDTLRLYVDKLVFLTRD
ncbi:hypothetical protein FS837_007033 [Tulasnella sp. UAMH 9824]|nr:hypothetical protein FS837_007033 [Tulasnella sp. UAMH 9824]